MNIHGEVSELWEAYRRSALAELCDKADKMELLGLEPLTNEEEELADTIIRALDYAKRRNLNIGKAVAVKHAYNVTRPYRHGGKAA